MDLVVENRPETCATLGLECGTCIQGCASTTATICQSLQPAGIRRIFFELFPSPGCHPMAAAFLQAYEEAVTPAKPIGIAARVSAAAAA